MIKKVQNIVSVFLIGIMVVMASGLNIDKHYCAINDAFDISIVFSVNDVLDINCEHSQPVQSCCEQKTTCDINMDDSSCCLDEFDFMLIPVLNQFIPHYTNIKIDFSIDYNIDFEIPEFFDKNNHTVENFNKLYSHLKNTYQAITQVFRL